MVDSSGKEDNIEWIHSRCTKCTLLQGIEHKICYKCGGQTEIWKKVCSRCGKPVGILDPCYDCQYPKESERPKGMPIGL